MNFFDFATIYFPTEIPYKWAKIKVTFNKTVLDYNEWFSSRWMDIRASACNCFVAFWHRLLTWFENVRHLSIVTPNTLTQHSGESKVSPTYRHIIPTSILQEDNNINWIFVGFACIPFEVNLEQRSCNRFVKDLVHVEYFQRIQTWNCRLHNYTGCSDL